jgi:hypothetical protein
MDSRPCLMIALMSRVGVSVRTSDPFGHNANKTDNSNNELLYDEDRAIAALHAQKLKNAAGVEGVSDPFAVVTKLAAAEPGSRGKVRGMTRPRSFRTAGRPNGSRDSRSTTSWERRAKWPTISIFHEVQKRDNKSMGTAVFDVAELIGAPRTCNSAAHYLPPFARPKDRACCASDGRDPSSRTWRVCSADPIQSLDSVAR